MESSNSGHDDSENCLTSSPTDYQSSTDKSFVYSDFHSDDSVDTTFVKLAETGLCSDVSSSSTEKDDDDDDLIQDTIEDPIVQEMLRAVYQLRHNLNDEQSDAILKNAVHLLQSFVAATAGK